jgi:hypothetical protein
VDGGLAVDHFTFVDDLQATAGHRLLDLCGGVPACPITVHDPSTESEVRNTSSR